jgi:uncharacterized membrane protein (DUF373 family)
MEQEQALASKQSERGSKTKSGLRWTLKETRDAWPVLSFYERFEQLIAVVLSALIAVVIIAAVCGLAYRLATMVLSGVMDPTQHQVFQAIFGMIMTVLIALEFNHTIMPALQRKRSLIRLRVVVLIALLALVRKFVILDASQTEPLTIIGLAMAVLSLGVVMWLVRDQDRKEAA